MGLTFWSCWHTFFLISILNSPWSQLVLSNTSWDILQQVCNKQNSTYPPMISECFIFIFILIPWFHSLLHSFHKHVISPCSSLLESAFRCLGGLHLWFLFRPWTRRMVTLSTLKNWWCLCRFAIGYIKTPPDWTVCLHASWCFKAGAKTIAKFSVAVSFFFASTKYNSSK